MTRALVETTVGERYALVGRLGEGGMGQVYRARHLELGKIFALKIIAPAFADHTAARARFNEEARLASEISHPNIVSVVDYGEDARLGAYMVMELVEGEALCDVTGPMSVRRACEVLGQIADALDHVHKLGIVHGDVKAENIMLATEPTGARRRRLARLLDFGLARRDHDDADQPISGTPDYLAPERAAGGGATVATDIYALGVLGYLLLTGTLPFSGSVVELLMAHIHHTPPALSERRGEPVDDALEALIARAMSKDPAARHTSASAFLYELKTVMHMLGVADRRKPTQPMRAVKADVSLASVLQRSRLPQVLVSAEGDIAWANAAFSKLVGRDALDGVALGETALASSVPDLIRCVRRVHVSGDAGECRARVARPGKASLEVVVWVAPMPLEGSDVHLVVRVAELSEPRPLPIRARV